MLTRCPACDTRFRVTAEQIKARLGRVRCGACQHAFNALDSLIEEPMLVLTAPPVAARSHFAPRDLVPPSISHATEPDAAVSPATEGIPCGAPTLEADFAPTHAHEATNDAAQVTSDFEVLEANQASSDIAVPLEAGDTADTPPDPVVPETGEHPELVTSVEADMGPHDAPAAETVESDEAVSTEVEIQDWDEVIPEPPPRRWPWITGSLLALLILGLQAALAFRVEMAVVWPETKPALVSLCDLAGCEVGLPAKVGLVGIEASDLHPDAETTGRLTLTATLKNRAPFAQEYPRLELTLTDTADKAVARKVLAPADYLPPRTAIADGMAPNVDIVVTVRVDSGDMAASGYRLYLFYP